MFVYLHRVCMYLHTPACIQAHIYSPSCCLRYPLGRHTFSASVWGTGLECRSAWVQQWGPSDSHLWRRTRRWHLLPVHHLSAILRAPRSQSKTTHIRRCGGRNGCVCAALYQLQDRAQWVQLPFCRQGYSHCSPSFTLSGCDEYCSSHTSSSHLPLAVFPVVQHVSPGCCRNEQQYVSWPALLRWRLPPRQTGCTAILVITLWFHLWGKNKLHFFLFFIA